MSTRKLNERISFETRATVFERSKNREVIITLEPSGVISLRLKGTTREYELTAEACYCSAVKASVKSERPRSRR